MGEAAMTNVYYIESKDDYYPVCVRTEATDHFDALCQFLAACGHRAGERIEVTDMQTMKSKTVICLQCPECCVPVFDEDEWTLTDRAGVFAHVDCYNTERVTE
jgi:hypothetical protein